MERGQATVGKGVYGAIVGQKKRLGTDFLTNQNDFCHVRLHNIRPGVDIAD